MAAGHAPPVCTAGPVRLGTGLRQGEAFGLAVDRIMVASVNRVARTYEPMLQACDVGRVDSSASRKSQ